MHRRRTRGLTAACHPQGAPRYDDTPVYQRYDFTRLVSRTYDTVQTPGPFCNSAYEWSRESSIYLCVTHDMWRLITNVLRYLGA